MNRTPSQILARYRTVIRHFNVTLRGTNDRIILERWKAYDYYIGRLIHECGWTRDKARSWLPVPVFIDLPRCAAP